MEDTRSPRPVGSFLYGLGAIAFVAVFVLPRAALAQKPLGIDVSYWQGASGISQANWNGVFAAGRTFAFCRCTHYSIPGTESDAHGDPDPSCGNNVARARNAGLLVGLYHFARPSIRDPITEANAFVNYATVYFGTNMISPSYMRPVLDLEDGSGAHTGAATLTDWVNQWMNRVQALTGVEPMIYTGHNYAVLLDSSINTRTLWFANYICGTDPQTGNPSASISPWANWTFWQYCSSLSVGNISPVDTDVFNGTAAQLQTYVIPANVAPVISNVAAGNIGADTATITWTTNVGATSQVKYGLTASYGSQTTLDSGLLTSHSVVLTGLTPNTPYHYQALSTNVAGSTQSLDFTFSTLGAPVISNVTATNLTYNGATITWTTNVLSDSQVDYGTTPSYGSSSSNASQVTSHSVTLSDLLSSTLYYYRVRSANVAGPTTLSGFTFTTTAVPPELIIDNTDAGCTTTGAWGTGTLAGVPRIGTNYLFIASSGSAGTTTATCRWTPSIPAGGGTYDVYVYYQIGSNRNPAAPFTVVYNGGSFTSVQNQTTGTVMWTKLNVSPLSFAAGTNGYVQVANNSASTGLISADAAKFVRVDTQAPTIPTNLVASAASTSSIQLNWTASTDDTAVSGYKIFRNSVQVGTSATPSYPDSGLTANTSYSYQVSAYDAIPNESLKSTPAVSRATLSVAPSAGSVTPNNSSACTGTSVTWTAVGGFGAGKVQYYRYAWDQSPTHIFIGSETQWSSGTLQTTPTATGNWYLHVKGYNSDNVANGTFEYSVNVPDSDGDGVANCVDGCPNDANKVAPGQCGCGTPDTDSDSDSVANCLDGCPNDASKIAAGQCGCGTPDTDTDGDGTPNCLDGCPTDASKTAPGVCGCGVADVDTDVDTVPDCIDNCPAATNSDQADADSDNIGDACDPCPHLPNVCPTRIVTQWRSVRTHDQDGALSILLDGAASGNGSSGPTVETRQGGITRIEVDFDGAVTLFDPSKVHVTGSQTSGGIMGSATPVTPSSVVAVDADTLAILFSPALADQSCYTMSLEPGAISENLGGDLDVNVRSLLGDLTGDGSVTLSDALAIKSKVASPASGAPQWDVDVSGGDIGMSDVLAAKSQIAAPAHQALCP